MSSRRTNTLKARQRFGKYRIERHVGEGTFADVYRAYDTIEGVRVALKIPHRAQFTSEVEDRFRDEARMVAKLDHPNILPIKNASFIQGRFVIVLPLGVSTLAERMQHRISTPKIMNLSYQMLAGLAYAHEQKIVHCDIKPENFILFDNGRIRLADFGIAKVAQYARTLTGSGTGTVGYLAPEQALGKPSFRSDVFSVGLIIYRLLGGHLPEWPFTWPPPGIERVRRLPADLTAFLRRALTVDEKARYTDARHMLHDFAQICAGLQHS